VSAVVVVTLALAGAAAVAAAVHHFGRDLPRFDSLRDYRPPVVTRVLARDGTPIATWYRERRRVLPLDRIPELLVQAVVAAEDDQFFHHEGLDYAGIVRALWANVRHGRVVQGGSTITQQVLKNFLLQDRDRWARKAQELLLARRIESNLTKYDLLYLYLNHIYFGHGCYGVAEAARFYFDKDVMDVGLAEAALLAGVLNGPAVYSPLRHPEAAKRRQRYVLKALARSGYVSEADAQAAERAPVVLHGVEDPWADLAPYYGEHVRQELAGRYGVDRVYEDGLSVRTAVDPVMQAAARDALRRGLERYDRGRGWRGPLAHLGEARAAPLVTALKARHTRLAEAAAERARGAAEAGFSGAAYDDTLPLVWDLAAVPDDVWKGSPGAIAGHARFPRLAVGGRYAGVVTRAGAKNAAVALGGVEATLDFAAVKWAHRKGRPPKQVSDAVSPGDVVTVEIAARPAAGAAKATLWQWPEVQGAIVALDPSTREVLAMVGGYDFGASPLNRAVQSQRQPGSAFKPILYTAAVNSRRYHGATIVRDAPFEYIDPWTHRVWRPENFNGEYRGELPLRQALAQSLNTVAVRVAQDIGTRRLVEMARRMGVTSELYDGLPLALGSSAVTLMELVNAYAVLASGGRLADPVLAWEVRDRDGRVLEATVSQPRQVLQPAVAAVVTDLLRSVVEEGTGEAVKAVGRPVAGKTGTTNDHRDVWFIGFTPQVVAGVWVGYDTPRPMGKGATGGGAAAPIWREFIETALNAQGAPVVAFAEAEGIERVRVDVPKLPPSMSAAVLEAVEARRKAGEEGSAPVMEERFEPMLPGTAPAPEEGEPTMDEHDDAARQGLTDLIRKALGGAGTVGGSGSGSGPGSGPGSGSGDRPPPSPAP
jgi:penicillin-binding protein 1A